MANNSTAAKPEKTDEEVKQEMHKAKEAKALAALSKDDKAPKDEPAKAAAPGVKKSITNMMYDVTDTSCSSQAGSRTHDVMIDGVIEQVTFTYPKPARMTFEKAAKFLKEGFIVRDETGKLLARPHETTVEIITQFGPNRVVAMLDELTREALYSRVAMLPGGEQYKPNSTKEELIDFLMELSRSKIKRNTSKKVEQGVDDGGEMTDKELAGMGIADDEAA